MRAARSPHGAERNAGTAGPEGTASAQIGMSPERPALDSASHAGTRGAAIRSPVSPHSAPLHAGYVAVSGSRARQDAKVRPEKQSAPEAGGCGRAKVTLHLMPCTI